MKEQTCQQCVHFIDDPGFIEAQVPNLTLFGSAYASARGRAGICAKRDLFLDPMQGELCPSFDLAGTHTGDN